MRSGLGRTLLLVLAAGIVLVLGYRNLGRFTGGSGPRIPVAAGDMKENDVVSGQALKLARNVDVTAATITDQNEIVGRKLIHPKQAGDPFYRDDFRRRTPLKTLAEALPPGRVLYTVDLPSLPVPWQGVRANDRVDILAAGKEKGRTRPRVIARDAIVLGWDTTKQPPPQPQRPTRRAGLMDLASAVPVRSQQAPRTPPLLLAVYPEDVFPLAETSGERIRIVLHGKKETESGRPLTIEPTVQTTAVEVIVGNRRETVLVQ